MSGPSRWALKLQAKAAMGRYPRETMRVGLVLMALAVGALLFQLTAGGFFLMDLDLDRFPMQTGIWPCDAATMANLLLLGEADPAGVSGGLLLALRLDAQGVVRLILVPWSILLPGLAVQFAVLLVRSPFQMGALEQFWRQLRGVEGQPYRPFAWYADLRLAGKAVALQLLLEGWLWCARLLCMLPGLGMLLLASRTGGGGPLLALAVALDVLGSLAGYYLFTLFLPAQYLMARSPGLSLGQALRRGWAVFRGRRKEFFLLRLSFLPWNLISALCNGIPDAYVYPYEETASLAFLDAVERPQGDVVV